MIVFFPGKPKEIANRMADNLAQSLLDEEKILQVFVQDQNTQCYFIIGGILTILLCAVFIGCTAYDKKFRKFCFKYLLLSLCEI